MNGEARQQPAAGTPVALAGFVLDLGAGALFDGDGRRVALRPQA